MTWFVVWVAAAALVGALAGQRERSGFGWFLLALVVSPLLAGVGLLIAGTGASQARCPACRELVRADALKCKHCGEALSQQAARDSADLAAYHRKQSRAIALALAAVAAAVVALKLLIWT